MKPTQSNVWQPFKENPKPKTQPIVKPNTTLVDATGKPLRPQTAVELVREAQQDWRLRLNPYEKRPQNTDKNTK